MQQKIFLMDKRVVVILPEYCKFGNFRENFIFANSVKTHIFDVEIRDKGVIYIYCK